MARIDDCLICKSTTHLLTHLRRKGHSGLKIAFPLSSSPLNDLRPLLADVTPEQAQGSTPSSNVLPLLEQNMVGRHGQW
jgi:hypothetical protein